MTTLTTNQTMKLLGVSASGLKRWLLDAETRRDYFPGAKKLNGRWAIPLVDVTALKQHIENGHENIAVDLSKLPVGNAFTFAEIAEYTGVSVNALRWIRTRGDFPHIHLADPTRIPGPHNPWLITRADLEEAIVPKIGRAKFDFVGEKESARLYLACSPEQAREISDRLTPQQRFSILDHFAALNEKGVDEAIKSLPLIIGEIADKVTFKGDKTG